MVYLPLQNHEPSLLFRVSIEIVRSTVSIEGRALTRNGLLPRKGHALCQVEDQLPQKSQEPPLKLMCG